MLFLLLGINPDKLYFGTETAYHVQNVVVFLIFEEDAK